MQYWIGVLTIVGIYMIAVLGVSILCGFTGMFSMQVLWPLGVMFRRF